MVKMRRTLLQLMITTMTLMMTVMMMMVLVIRKLLTHSVFVLQSFLLGENSTEQHLGRVQLLHS